MGMLKKILLTGGTGFLGSTLGELLEVLSKSIQALLNVSLDDRMRLCIKKPLYRTTEILCRKIIYDKRMCIVTKSTP